MSGLRRTLQAPGLGLGLALLLSLSSTATADTRVWLDANTGTYHCPGSLAYGSDRRGSYVSETAAISQGYRAAQGQPCSAPLVARTSATPRTPSVQRLRR